MVASVNPYSLGPPGLGLDRLGGGGFQRHSGD